MLIKVIMTKEMSDYMVMWMPDIHVHVLTYKNLVWSITVDFEEVKTAPTECKEKRFQMSHLPIFTIVKHLNVDDSS